MASLVTRFLSLSAAQSLNDAISGADMLGNSYYLWIGRISPWPDENAPPATDSNESEIQFGIWREIISTKKITTEDIQFAWPRVDWTTGVNYAEYDSSNNSLFTTDPPTGANSHFVMTDDFNVYKVLFNNKGAASTVKPTGTSTNTLLTADGYEWKFLYNLSTADQNRYLTPTWVPVRTLTSDDGSNQWNVQQAAANGAIDVIDVRASGNNYLMTNGVFSNVNSSFIVELANTASDIDGIYNGSSIFISSGLGAGQASPIINYVGATRRLTCLTPLGTQPNTSSTYIVSPGISISGDGTGATAYCNVVTANNSGGPINRVIMINKGSNYTKADVTISANSLFGTGGEVEAIIPPIGGHGSDPVKELNAGNLMLAIQTPNTVSGNFPIVNDFRRFGILKDITLTSNGSIAEASAYDLTTRLNLTNVTGTGLVTLDETITGSVSGATAKVVGFANTNGANTAGTLRVIDANGVFTTSDIITAATSGVTGLISSITDSDINRFSGELLYVNNIIAIERGPLQTEEFKIVIRL